MPTTPILDLPYPALANVPDVPRDIRALALALDSAQLGWSIGDIKFSLQSIDHPGWVLLDGVPRTRASYPTAFGALMDSLLGVHPDPTKVSIPNMTRRTAVGANPGGPAFAGVVPNLAAAGGEETHALSVAEMPTHHHSVLLSLRNGGTLGANDLSDSPARMYGGAASGSVEFPGNVTDNNGSSTSHNNIPPFFAGNWFIATSGAGGGSGGAGAGTGALDPSSDVPLATALLAAGAGQSGVINIGGGFRISRISADQLCRVRLYSTPARRDADVARPLATEPPDYPTPGSTPNHGVMLEENFVAANLVAGAYVQDLSPNVIGSSGETPRSNNIAYRVDNTGVAAHVINVTLNVQVLETV